MKINLKNGRELDVAFVSMEALDVLPPKKDMNGGQKLDDQGNPLFNARALKAVRIENGRSVGSDDAVSLALREQPGKLAFLGIYALDGNVSIVHYVQNNGRLGVSITADRVVPLKKEA